MIFQIFSTFARFVNSENINLRMSNLLKPFVFLIFLINFGSILGQYDCKGKVFDSQTKRPIPFANVAAYNNGLIHGTTTNIDGEYELKLTQAPDSIIVSCVGHQKIRIFSCKSSPIYLELRETKFDEVLVLPGENPALRIIRNTVDHRNQNDIEQFLTFSYEAYTLFNADVEPMKEDNLNSIEDTATLKIMNFFSNKQAFVAETYSKTFYQPKNNKKELILGSKTSGLKNPIFSIIANQIQPFSAYTNPLNLFSTEYLNPISSGGMKGYFYILQDTTYLNNDTLFIIDFHPKLNSSFSGTHGTVYVNASDWSINRIIFNFENPFGFVLGQDENGNTTMSTELNKSANNFATIILSYEKHGGYWLPMEVRTIYPLGVLKGELPINIYNTSYFKKYLIGDYAERVSTGGATVRVQNGATERTDSLWNEVRTNNHDLRIDETYIYLDSSADFRNLDRILHFSQSLIEGKVKMGIVDLDVNKIISFNDFEGFRLGMGLETNERILKAVRIGGYTGYGFRDKTWKYGGHLRWIIAAVPQLQAKASYQFDVNETGIYNFLDPTGRVDQSELIRNAYVKKMDYTESIRLDLGGYIYRSLHLRAFAEQKNVQTGYDYNFTEQANSGDFFKLFESGVEMLWRIKDQFVQLENTRLYLKEPRFPIIQMQLVRGWDNMRYGDYAYHRLQFRVSQQFKWLRFGTLSLRGEYQQTFGDVPLPLLIYTPGILNRKFGISALNIFETAQPNEFLSDRMMVGFLRFEFNPWQIVKDKFEPIISLRFNAGWGALNNPERHQLVLFKTMNQGFYEAGIVFDNLLNLGVAGYGFGVFYRIGPYASTNEWHNLAFKLSLRIGQ